MRKLKKENKPKKSNNIHNQNRDIKENMRNPLEFKD